MGEQVAITDRSKKRQGGHDRLGHHPSHHRLRHESRREPPQPPAGAAELRHDGFLRQRDERAQRLDAELQQPAVRVGVEREHGEPLGGEELRLPSHGHDDRFSRFGARRGHPGDELSDAPPNAECGMRNFREGSFASRRLPLHSAFPIPHSAFGKFRNPHSALRISIVSTISSGSPYNPSNPSVPTNTLPSSTGSTTGLTVTSAATSRANCSS